MENLGKQIKWKDAATSPALICFFLVLLVVAVYWRVTGFEFLNYDDPTYISENLHVQKGLTAQNVSWAFRTTELASWYPLTWLSFMLDVSLFGHGAVGPHFMNVLLHAANAVLSFLFLRSLTGAHWKSALVAGLFALHPLHVESVAWISERKDVLSTFFSLPALWLYVGYVRSESTRLRARYYLLAVFFFILALLSKPMQVTLPCIMLLLDFWPMKRLERQTAWILIREKIPFFILALIFAGITIAVHRNTDALVSLGEAPMAGRVQNAFVSYARYLGKTIWPVDLIVPYSHPGDWPPVATVLSVLLFCALCFVGARFWRRWPFVTVGWLWFAGALLPVMGIIAWGSQSMADRFTYFPLVGIFVAVVWLAEEMFSLIQAPKIILGVLVMLILAACAGRTIDQIHYWQNSETLFQHTLAVEPENSVARYALGSALADAGHLDEAIDDYQQALKISTNNPEMLNSLGKVWAQKGKYELAISCYQRAIDIKPRFAAAHCSLGNALEEMKQPGRAREEFNESLRLDAEQAAAYCGLGNVAADEGKSDEALVDYRKALEIDAADAVAHCGIANLLSQSGRLQDAVDEYRLALQYKPHFVEAENNLGTILLRSGHADEAVQNFRDAIKDEPGHLGAHVNLGNALAEQGKLDEAAMEFTKAVALDTNSLAAQFGLGVVSARLGRQQDAVEHLKEALRIKPDYAGAKQMLEKFGAGASQ